ncbi:type II CAAX endopeptidase family protein [Lentibacillus sp. N15]|uniref:CPBP family intramembrane glutamic endopeptidase n=1 Tax=Lentibacillus songyuanensis TaxID=3136161 RepID=UPI0031BB858B
MYIKKLGEGISTISLFLYLIVIFTIFSLGQIFDHSYYLYPGKFIIASAGIILLISFLYPPTRKLYLKVLVWTAMKKVFTYFWIVLVYVALFYLNRLFFKYGFFMDEQFVNHYNLGIRYAFISFQEFLLYLLTSCLLIPIWEELVHRVCIMVLLSRFLPVWSSVILQAVIFGLLHMQKPVLVGVFALLSLFLFYKTKSIIPSIVLHILFNLHGGLLTFYHFDFVPRW